MAFNPLYGASKTELETALSTLRGQYLNLLSSTSGGDVSATQVTERKEIEGRIAEVFRELSRIDPVAYPPDDVLKTVITKAAFGAA